MQNRRWYNPNLPQTLVIAQFLLYFDAFWLVLAVLTGTGAAGISSGLIGFLIGLAGIAAYVYGASGIASEQKIGYQVAIAASFIPLARRIVLVFIAGASVTSNLGFILLGGSILNAIFEYALIALLLHPMSKEHQKIWFT